MRMRGDINIYSLIHNLKHGYRILSPKNWVSFSQFHIFAGVLGITGLVLAIKDGKIGSLRGLPSISDSGDSSEESLLVPGLRNLGNNCFLNVILQALASCEGFHSFLRNISERDGFLVDERVESMPLTVALFALIEELCKPRDERMTLNPRRVMLAMDHYIPSFNLTSQQDAAEAFLHLLSSLKEETSEFYVPDHGSLAEISAFPECKISRPNRRGLNEQERWQQDFLGPFNGTLGSSLTCKTCSSQLSVDFEFFHSLPLSPLFDDHGCSVEQCLKQFTSAELIDNYRCNRCWHIAAIKYFSTVGGHELHIEKVNSCVGEDSCDCRNLFPQGVPWTNNISRTLKQLSIVRCPKILCIHLQRASVNGFGELVKLQGHISFPMLLDLFPYTTPVVGVRKENLGANVERMQVNQLQSPITRFDQFNMQFATQMLRQMYGQTGEKINITSEPLVGNEEGNTKDSAGDRCAQTLKPESGAHRSEGCSYPEFTVSPLQPINGWTGQDINISSEPLVRDMVGDANDFVGDKSTQALEPEPDVHHSEGCPCPEITGSPLQPIDGGTGENINSSSEPLVGDGNTNDSLGDKFAQALKPESVVHRSKDCCSCPTFTGLPVQSDGKSNNSRHLVPAKSYMYRLVSVVEHFGRVGSGHYTVYRRLRKSDDSNSVELLGRSRWFCISDSNVLSVSERDVLAADASLLFYERIKS